MATLIAGCGSVTSASDASPDDAAPVDAAPVDAAKPADAIVGRVDAAPRLCAGALVQSRSDLVALDGCSVIDGNLEIVNADGFADLAPLAALRDVRGYVIIRDNAELTSLAGLEGLESVEGLAIVDNWALTSAELDALQSGGVGFDWYRTAVPQCQIDELADRLRLACNCYQNADC